MISITLVPAAKARAKLDLGRLPPHVKPTPGTGAYLTGAYLSTLALDEPSISTEYCHTRDKAHRWVEVFLPDEDSIEVVVLDGNTKTIKALVQGEFRHAGVKSKWCTA